MGLFKKKPVDPEVKAAYDAAYKQEQIRVATERGRQAAHRKPFYQQLSGGLSAVVKDFSTTKGRRDDPFGLFGNDRQPLKPRRKRTKRKRPKR